MIKDNCCINVQWSGLVFKFPFKWGDKGLLRVSRPHDS